MLRRMHRGVLPRDFSCNGYRRSHVRGRSVTRSRDIADKRLPSPPHAIPKIKTSRTSNADCAFKRAEIPTIPANTKLRISILAATRKIFFPVIKKPIMQRCRRGCAEIFAFLRSYDQTPPDSRYKMTPTVSRRAAWRRSPLRILRKLQTFRDQCAAKQPARSAIHGTRDQCYELRDHVQQHAEYRLFDRGCLHRDVITFSGRPLQFRNSFFQ